MSHIFSRDSGRFSIQQFLSFSIKFLSENCCINLYSCFSMQMDFITPHQFNWTNSTLWSNNKSWNNSTSVHDTEVFFSGKRADMQLLVFTVSHVSKLKISFCVKFWSKYLEVPSWHNKPRVGSWAWTCDLCVQWNLTDIFYPLKDKHLLYPIKSFRTEVFFVLFCVLLLH